MPGQRLEELVAAKLQVLKTAGAVRVEGGGFRG